MSNGNKEKRFHFIVTKTDSLLFISRITLILFLIDQNTNGFDKTSTIWSVVIEFQGIISSLILCLKTSNYLHCCV